MVATILTFSLSLIVIYRLYVYLIRVHAKPRHSTHKTEHVDLFAPLFIDAKFHSTIFFMAALSDLREFSENLKFESWSMHAVFFPKVYRLWDNCAFISTHSLPTPPPDKICKIFPQMPHSLDSPRLFFSPVVVCSGFCCWLASPILASQTRNTTTLSPTITKSTFYWVFSSSGLDTFFPTCSVCNVCKHFSM